MDPTGLPFISIGDRRCITAGVTILDHDWSACVLAEASKQMLPAQRKTIIGNNVFIGMGSILLMGAEIGDNVVIGAGAVVGGKVESNAVYTGNPARKVMTLEQYYEKLKKNYIPSAKLYAEVKREQLGRVPTPSEKYQYRTMFTDKNPESVKSLFANSIYMDAYVGIPKMYDSVEELLGQQL